MQTNNNPRVALSKILVLAEYLQTRCGVPKSVANEISEIKRIAEAALAAPPRNCDVYNNESCRMAYHLHGSGLMTMQAFADWLFAPATEKEGGAK